MEGKPVGRAAGAVTAQPGRPGRLGLLVDEATGDSFLVDTGAVYSVVPYTSSLPPTGPNITTANGKPIPCWGGVVRVIRAGGRWIQWTFLRAAVSFPILGADLLEEFDFMVDLKRLKLVCGTGGSLKLKAPPIGSIFATIGIKLAERPQAHSLSRPATAAGVNAPSGSPAAPETRDMSARVSTGLPLQHRLSTIGSSQQHPDYGQLLEKFPDVLNPSKVLPAVKHCVEHYIETEGRPVNNKYRRLDQQKLAEAKAEFAEMEKQGVVRRSSSSWASPLHMVRKSDGTWRLCGDFRRLNLQTRPDLYSCPNIADLTARLAGCRVFSKLDLRKGYHQVPVRAEDIPKTAVITPFGLFEFRRMPFGLRNAGQTFQRMMDSVLSGLQFCFVYLDDVLVASPTHQEHVQHLEKVLQRLETHGLVLNAEKCQLGVKELDYLGHHVSATGITPIIGRVEAIKSFPQPKTVKQLQTYLGMVNFYRRFLPKAAQVLKPLTDSLKGGKPGEVAWTKEMEEAFVDSKRGLYNSVELAHPELNAQLSLTVDASDSHVGAVLNQHVEGRERPLAFFSVKLDAAQSKYSAFDRELLAVYLSIRHFRWILEGRKFHVFSDHKPLQGALHRIAQTGTARQQRHFAFVAEFTSDIRHISGASNVVADALSRPAAAVSCRPLAISLSRPAQAAETRDRHAGASTELPTSAVATLVPPTSARVRFKDIATSQSTCQQTEELIKNNNSLSFQQVEIEGTQLWCDISTGVIRPVVPQEQRKHVFETIHGLAHPGTRATRRMVASRFVWEGC